MKFRNLILGTVLLVPSTFIFLSSCTFKTEQAAKIREQYFENNKIYNSKIAEFAKKLENLKANYKKETDETKKNIVEQQIFDLYFESHKVLQPLIQEYNYLFKKLRDAEKRENSQLRTIKIFHSNDEHSRLQFDDGKFNKYIGMIDFSKYLAEKNKDLVLSAGDLIQGLPLSDSDKGKTISQIAKFIGYDSVAVGNHEFDYGLNYLLELDKEQTALKNGASTPFISANIYWKNFEKEAEKPEGYDPSRVGKRVFKPYIIKELISGIKVAIFGITTPDTVFTSHPRNSKLVEFRDPTVSANEVISEIKKAEPEVKFIIATTHLGTDRNEEKWTSEYLAQNADPELDLILDGHSHTYVPINKKAAEEKNIYISQTSHYTKFLGDIDLVFDTKTGKIAEVHQVLRNMSEIEIYNSDLPSRLVEKLKKAFDKENKVVVFNSPGEFEHTTTQKVGETNFSIGRIKPTSLGVFAADAFAWDFVKQESTKSHNNWEDAKPDNSIGLVNGGGLRANFAKGEITREVALSVSPFGNLISSVRIKGKILIEVLKHGLSRAKSGAFSQLSSNVSYKVKVEKGIDPITKRNDYVWTPDVSSFKIGSKPIDPEKYYYLSTNDFILEGGDGYSMLDMTKKENNDKLELAYQGGKFIDVLIEFAKKGTENSNFNNQKKFERNLSDYLNKSTYSGQVVEGLPTENS
ncbi:bifunctional UDP-sugar hydrolase/5'-nucleotidase [Mycoplasma sp. 'Moose RK']|uniref:bifunctional metallophosphatase/5'-nucleotidase n=1 Tax=Mycoplasma sp. 'Moose RK' TaxID=2780095 RepID=UPI00280B0546|nr:bifunctional UDP-sugar hydrolase/5'-nucleotidase [Mycoplasma sp. 'Moose RK']